MVSVNVNVDAASVASLQKQMERARKELGKSRVDAMGQAGYYIARSLGASTKMAPKMRPIVKNPDERYKTDHRRAPFGVFKYDGNGNKRFVPIYRTGEFGQIRFFDKKSMAWFQREKGSKGKWERLPSGPDAANPEVTVPGIKTDKRRVIGRRGLAKQSWKGLQKRTKYGGVVGAMGVNGIASATYGPAKISLRLRNELRYIRKAIKGGESALNNVVARAADAMRGALDKRISQLAKA